VAPELEHRAPRPAAPRHAQRREPIVNFHLRLRPEQAEVRIHLDVAVPRIEQAVEIVKSVGSRFLDQRYEHSEGRSGC
jgi:hypothetical protein